ncbi:MAG: hydroxymethylglutaryl-CoA lyase, partial [Bacteroidetes bacterium]|nr:hydroxymethylglutaryl-CoA lyase [Bacteroidota bacterium]
MVQKVKLIECPRDAMQGIHKFIPTNLKILYLNLLLQAGFDTLDIGSFVSPKAIPQLADTKEVLENIAPSETKLLTIVANTRGMDEAVKHHNVTYLGYPFSVSETFQQKNTNASITHALEQVKYLKQQCDNNGKIPVVYISMGFGNPYGDAWNTDIVCQWVEKLVELNIPIISLADTTGIAEVKSIDYLFKKLILDYPETEFGAHFHTLKTNWKEKVEAATNQGCRRFDGAFKGFGGCPMA